MSRAFAREFYDSVAWKNTRRAYASAAGGLCERCLRAGRYVPGEIVHHKIHLTPDNIQDPGVLSWSAANVTLRSMTKKQTNVHRSAGPWTNSVA